MGFTAANTGVGTARPATFLLKDDGFTGGGQVGHNYQFGGFGGGGIVIGVEADANYMDIAMTGSSVGVDGLGQQALSNLRSSIDSLGTVRGRLGSAFNQLLIYGTGGFAYGDTLDSTTLFTAGDNRVRNEGDLVRAGLNFKFGTF